MTTGPSDAEISKQFWKSRFTRLKNEIEENNPSMVKPSAGAKAFQPIQDAAVAGASTRAFLTAFQGDNVSSGVQKVSPGEVAASRQRTIEALVKAGKSDDEIQSFLEKTSGYVDALAMAGNDSTMATLLFNRVMTGGNQQLTMKDMIETIRLAQDLRGPNAGQHQSEMAEVIKALAQFNKGGSDPAQAFNNAASLLGPLYQQMNTANRESFDRYLGLLHEQMDRQSSNNPLDLLRQVKETQDILGKITGKESEAIALKRMEFEHDRFKANQEAELEKRKQAGQQELIKTITGNLGKVLESPIVKKVGENLGETLGRTSPTAAGVVRAVARAPEQAANAELQTPPTHVRYQYTCQKCNTPHSFTALEISEIEDRNGKWTCPICGFVYQYNPSGEDEGEHGGT